MSTKNDGGSAFPLIHQDAAGEWRGPIQSFRGLSIRQYYAVKVIAAIISNPGITPDDWTDRCDVVKLAFEFADAMIEEGNK